MVVWYGTFRLLCYSYGRLRYVLLHLCYEYSYPLEQQYAYEYCGYHTVRAQIRHAYCTVPPAYCCSSPTKIITSTSTRKNELIQRTGTRTTHRTVVLPAAAELTDYRTRTRTSPGKQLQCDNRFARFRKPSLTHPDLSTLQYWHQFENAQAKSGKSSLLLCSLASSVAPRRNAQQQFSMSLSDATHATCAWCEKHGLWT